MTTITLEPINRSYRSRQPKAVSPAHVLPFRTEPDTDIYSQPGEHEDIGKSWNHVRTADSYAVTDPLEYFFYSVISGAAVISILIGILSLPSTGPGNSELSKTARSQESSLVIPSES